MTIFRFLTATLLVSLTLVGCGRLGSPKLDVETFQLEHRSGREAEHLIAPYVFMDREESPGTMSSTDDAVTVRETRDNLEKIRRVLAEYDQPIPAIRLRFQLIEADSFREADPAIADVVQELRSLFRFEGYRLLGEAVALLRGGSGGPQSFTQRILGVENPMEVEVYARVGSDGTVRLETVELRDTWDELLTASVSIQPGQTLVLGGTQARTRLAEGGRPSGNSSLILTVRAELE